MGLRVSSAHALAALSAALLCAGMTWSPSASASETDPPVSLSPANGTRFVPGQTITFRVRGSADDDPEYLWVHVSRSPRQVKACGTIGYDVDLKEFSRTSESHVYAATARTGDDIEGTGTFYWQAHRISYADDADGCIEGPVRSFVVSASPKPNRLPGLYRGKTTQDRGLSFRLATSRTEITRLDTSISLSCSRGRLRTRLAFRDITVRRDGSFAQTISSSNFTITGSQTATLRGKFRSPTRVTGTLSSNASFPSSVGRCGFRRYSWTARRSGI